MANYKQMAEIFLESGLAPQSMPKEKLEALVKRCNCDQDKITAELEVMKLQPADQQEDWKVINKNKKKLQENNSAQRNDRNRGGRGNAKPDQNRSRNDRRGGDGAGGGGRSRGQQNNSNRGARTDSSARNGVRSRGGKAADPKVFDKGPVGEKLNVVDPAAPNVTIPSNPTQSVSVPAANGNAWVCGPPKLLERQKEEEEAKKPVSVPKSAASDPLPGEGENHATKANNSQPEGNNVTKGKGRGGSQRQQQQQQQQPAAPKAPEINTNSWAAKVAAGPAKAAPPQPPQQQQQQSEKVSQPKAQVTSDAQEAPKAKETTPPPATQAPVATESKPASGNGRNQRGSKSGNKNVRGAGKGGQQQQQQQQQGQSKGNGRGTKADPTSNKAGNTENAAQQQQQKVKLPEEFQQAGGASDSFAFGNFGLDPVKKDEKAAPASKIARGEKKMPAAASTNAEASNSTATSSAQLSGLESNFMTDLKTGTSSSSAGETAKMSPKSRIHQSLNEGKAVNATDYESEALAKADAKAANFVSSTPASNAVSSNTPSPAAQKFSAAPEPPSGGPSAGSQPSVPASQPAPVPPGYFQQQAAQQPATQSSTPQHQHIQAPQMMQQQQQLPQSNQMFATQVPSNDASTPSFYEQTPHYQNQYPYEMYQYSGYDSQYQSHGHSGPSPPPGMTAVPSTGSQQHQSRAAVSGGSQFGNAQVGLGKQSHQQHQSGVGSYHQGGSKPGVPQSSHNMGSNKAQHQQQQVSHQPHQQQQHIMPQGQHHLQNQANYQYNAYGHLPYYNNYGPNYGYSGYTGMPPRGYGTGPYPSPQLGFEYQQGAQQQQSAQQLGQQQQRGNTSSQGQGVRGAPQGQSTAKGVSPLGYQQQQQQQQQYPVYQPQQPQPVHQQLPPQPYQQHQQMQQAYQQQQQQHHSGGWNNSNSGR